MAAAAAAFLPFPSDSHQRSSQTSLSRNDWLLSRLIAYFTERTACLWPQFKLHGARHGYWQASNSKTALESERHFINQDEKLHSGQQPRISTPAGMISAGSIRRRRASQFITEETVCTRTRPVCVSIGEAVFSRGRIFYLSLLFEAILNVKGSGGGGGNGRGKNLKRNINRPLAEKAFPPLPTAGVCERRDASFESPPSTDSPGGLAVPTHNCAPKDVAGRRESGVVVVRGACEISPAQSSAAHCPLGSSHSSSIERGRESASCAMHSLVRPGCVFFFSVRKEPLSFHG